MKPWLQYLPLPVILGVVALTLFWFLSRWDGAQTARLQELDRQQDETVAQALTVAKARKAADALRSAAVAASLASEARIAALRASQARYQADLAAARVRASQVEGQVDSLLALGDSGGIPAPVRGYIESQRAQIVALRYLLDSRTEEGDSLKADRDRWRTQAETEQRQAELERGLAEAWKGRAEDWRGQARRGCLPLVGCVNRSVVFLAGAALGVAGTVAVGH